MWLNADQIRMCLPSPDERTDLSEGCIFHEKQVSVNSYSLHLSGAQARVQDKKVEDLREGFSMA